MPESALKLRAALATFGLIFCVLAGVLAWRAGVVWLAWPLFFFALVGAVDLYVIFDRMRHHHGPWIRHHGPWLRHR
ncbi:hypothetical protein [Longispora albida]|uniref:hypothetical protein n=1 Tax=Longispora albida TaxID=203523 RepID=UPI00036DD7EF|nr:hypothetical protein [Longispora albida]